MQGAHWHVDACINTARAVGSGGRGGDTGIIPVKDSHSRINPLALGSGHGRYTTVTPERTLVSVGKWPLHISDLDLVSTPLPT
jgi:hypothetical protein